PGVREHDHRAARVPGERADDRDLERPARGARQPEALAMAPKAPAKPDPAAKGDAADAAAEAPPPKKKRGLLFLIVGVVLLAGCGAGGWFFVVPKYFAHAKEAPEPPAEDPVHETVSLGAVVVNVTSAESRRYVKVGVALGVPSEHVAKEVEKFKPQLLDLL